MDLVLDVVIVEDTLELAELVLDDVELVLDDVELVLDDVEVDVLEVLTTQISGRAARSGGFGISIDALYEVSTIGATTGAINALARVVGLAKSIVVVPDNVMIPAGPLSIHSPFSISPNLIRFASMSGSSTAKASNFRIDNRRLEINMLDPLVFQDQTVLWKVLSKRRQG